MRGLLRETDAADMRYPEHVDPPTPRTSTLAAPLRENMPVPGHVVQPDAVIAPWKKKPGERIGWKPDDAVKQRTGALLHALHELRRAGKSDQKAGSKQAAADDGPASATPGLQLAAGCSSPPPAAAASAAAAQTPVAEAAVADPERSASAGEKSAPASDGTLAAAEPADAEPAEEEEGGGINSSLRLAKDPAGLEDLPVFQQTLCSLQDSEGTLRRLSEEIKSVYGEAQGQGGLRHPTSIVALRTIAVIDRKLELVTAVQTRLDKVQAAYDRRKEVVKAVVAGTSETPPEIQGLSVFVKRYIHPGGNPLEADKSDFLSFVRSFGLPQKHNTISRIASLLAEFSDFWMVATLEQANAGISVDAIMRMLDVAKSMAGGKKSPAMEEASKGIADAIGNQVLVFAQELKKKDEFAVARSDTPAVESARKCAVDINTQIKEAVNTGCDTKHPALSEAKVIATELDMACKTRTAQKALMHAQLQKIKDDKAEETAKEGEIVDPGIATRLAESIDDAIKKAIKEGAPKVHEFLSEASQIASQLRQKDGERKRLKARQERMAKESDKQK